MLSAVIFFPLAVALPVLFFDPSWRRRVWAYATVFSGIELLLTLSLLLSFDFSRAHEFQLVERYVLLGLKDAPYVVGVDGFALLLMILTAFLTFLGFVSSYNYIKHQIREYVALMFALETAMMGVFASLNLIQFFIFWEVQLLPMFLLIALWGHEGRRTLAAYKFLIYTAIGSVPLIVAIIWLYLTFGSFDYLYISQRAPELPLNVQKLLFLAFSLGFMIKVPMFPFHTWLPDAHTEAPTAGSVILAGILLKMGIFGFLRYSIPMFPLGFEAYKGLIAALAITGIIYAGLVAWVQPDMKRLIAYSSVAHMGFAMLGIASDTPIGVQGAVVIAVSHGLTTGALFFLVGMLYERRHTRLIRDFSGIAKLAPNLSTSFVFMSLASIGLPGLSGFVGEFLSLMGAYQHNPLWAYLAVPGVVIAAVYMLSLVKKVVFGKPKGELQDLSLREGVILLALVIPVVAIGVYPKLVTDFTHKMYDKVVALK